MGAMVVMVCGLAAWSGADVPQGAQAAVVTAQSDAGRAQIGRSNASIPSPHASPVRPAAIMTNLFLPPVALEVTAPAAPTEAVHMHGEGVHEYYGGEECGDQECSPCRKHHRCGCWRCCVRSTCDMVPHQWYYPENHGYYYFRPYNYAHVATQQEFIKSVDGDPRNPYADGLFERLYEEMGGATVEPYVSEAKE